MSSAMVRARTHVGKPVIARQAKVRNLDSFDVELVGGAASHAGLLIHPKEHAAVILRLHGRQASKEYVLRTVNRLVMRGMPLDGIAQLFDVTVRTASRWKREIADRLGREISVAEVNSLVGESLSFYREIRAQAMREGDISTGAQRIAAYRLAMDAENSLHDMMQAAGVYEVKKFVPDAQGYKTADQARDIVMAVRDILAGEFTEFNEPTSSTDHEITLL